MKFMPSGREVRVEAGTTLLAAARKAELPIASACGENQLCSLCGLEILKGAGTLAPEPDSEAHIKELNRVDSELRLSCKLEVAGDLVVTAQYW